MDCRKCYYYSNINTGLKGRSTLCCLKDALLEVLVIDCEEGITKKENEIRKEIERKSW